MPADGWQARILIFLERLASQNTHLPKISIPPRTLSSSTTTRYLDHLRNTSSSPVRPVLACPALPILTRPSS